VKEGEIETVAERILTWSLKEEIDPGIGLQAFQTRKIAFNLGLDGKSFHEMTEFIFNYMRHIKIAMRLC